jgi:hypothetical protein
MEWSKLPTNLITRDLSDAEILAIVKYQLVFSLTEIEPSDKILSKFLTKKQKTLAKNFIAEIKSRVENDIQTTQNKRNRNKTYYNNNKGLGDLPSKNSDGLKDDCQPPQIREDKIREDKNIYSYIGETKKIDPYLNPYRDKFVEEYKKVFGQTPMLSLKSLDTLAQLAVINPDLMDLIPIAIEKLSRIKFDINFKPRADWLLKEGNFEKVINDQFEDSESSMFEGLDFNGGVT